MSKVIVFCADGTWNGPGAPIATSVSADQDNAGELSGNASTNVYKLFCNLDGDVTADTRALQQEKEKALQDAAGNVVQVAKYIHGVGDSSNLLDKVMGGVLGAGVISRIVRGYTFISRNYQPGDAIYITGFSRGAYTARALAGMISRVGLLNPTKYDVNNKEEAYRRGKAAWYQSKGLTFTGKSFVVRWFNRGVDWVEGLLGRKDLSKADLLADVPIKAVAVWDTVGSMGVPLYLSGARIDLFRFTDENLSSKVEYGFHAMAIDEMRIDFPVTPWKKRKGIEQLWFVGAHADVGGGYPQGESRLSDVAFEWMMRKLGGVGVQWLLELQCKPDCACSLQAPHDPWDRPPFNLGSKRARKPNADDVFHTSVVERWQSDARYRPTALSFVTDATIKVLTVLT